MAHISLRFIPDFDEANRKLAAMEAGFDRVASAVMDEMAPDFFGAAVEPIRDVTDQMHFVTGKLGASTQVADDSIETGPQHLRFDVIQPAESEPNVTDGMGGGFHYAQMVLPPWWTGGPPRRRLEAPRPVGPYSSGRKAFAGPDFGPVKAFTQYAGDPYPLLARDQIESLTERLARRYGERVLEELLKL